MDAILLTNISEASLEATWNLWMLKIERIVWEIELEWISKGK